MLPRFFKFIQLLILTWSLVGIPLNLEPTRIFAAEAPSQSSAPSAELSKTDLDELRKLHDQYLSSDDYGYYNQITQARMVILLLNQTESSVLKREPPNRDQAPVKKTGEIDQHASKEKSHTNCSDAHSPEDGLINILSNSENILQATLETKSATIEFTGGSKYRIKSWKVPELTTIEDTTQFWIPVQQLKKQRVLSLGEGKGTIVAELTLQGAEAYGIDLDEDYAKKKFYYPMLSERLIHGDATDFSKREFARQKFDQVISMCLACQLDTSLNEKMILEGLRVLKAGGSFRIGWCKGLSSEDESSVLDLEFLSMLKRVKAKAKSEGMELDLGISDLYYDDEDNPRFRQLMIQKTK